MAAAGTRIPEGMPFRTRRDKSLPSSQWKTESFQKALADNILHQESSSNLAKLGGYHAEGVRLVHRIAAMYYARCPTNGAGHSSAHAENKV